MSSMGDESFQQGGREDLVNLASNEAMLPDAGGAAGLRNPATKCWLLRLALVEPATM